MEIVPDLGNCRLLADVSKGFVTMLPVPPNEKDETDDDCPNLGICDSSVPGITLPLIGCKVKDSRGFIVHQNKTNR